MKPKIELLNADHLDHSQYYSNPIISNSGLGGFYNKLTDAKAMNAKPETLFFGQLMHLGLYEAEAYANTPKTLPAKLQAQCERMIAAGRKTPVLSGFLKDKRTVFEKPFYAIINGVPVKVKPDAFIPNSRLGHDAKSTAKTTLEGCLESMEEFRYWRQAALYTDATGGKNWLFTFITKSEPCKTFLVDCSKHKDKIKEGREEYQELLKLYAEMHPDYISKAKKYLSI